MTKDTFTTPTEVHTDATFTRPEPFTSFEQLTKRLLSVPKKEVDEKEQERPKRKPRSKK